MSNQEIEAQLQALTEMCCESMEGDQALDVDRMDQLTKALLMSGYSHQPSQPLSAELEGRVREQCREPAIHRGAEIKGLTEKVEGSFQKHVRWESRQPKASGKSKAANISSATDA